jgi:2Fe-2S ferredoxin
MVRIQFESADGTVRPIDAPPGETLMAAAKAQGVPGIEAECGGSMVCGTCHVHVREPWFSRIGAPSAMETDMLDCALHPAAGSRLSCQIVVTAAMEGMEVGVPPSQR